MKSKFKFYYEDLGKFWHLERFLCISCTSHLPNQFTYKMLFNEGLFLPVIYLFLVAYGPSVMPFVQCRAFTYGSEWANPA